LNRQQNRQTDFDDIFGVLGRSGGNNRLDFGGFKRINMASHFTATEQRNIFNLDFCANLR